MQYDLRYISLQSESDVVTALGARVSNDEELDGEGADGARPADWTRHESVGLTWPERTAAGLIGASAIVAGAISVFTTENQAGSATLVVVGAVMLVMAIQGTAVRRANRESIELDPRARRLRVEYRAKEILVKRGPDSASEFVDGAIDSAPEILAISPLSDLYGVISRARTYKESVTQKLEQLTARESIFVQSRTGDDGVHIQIVESDGAPSVDVLTIFSEPSDDAQYDRIRRALNRVSRSRTPVLVVTNTLTMANEVRSELKGGDAIRSAASSAVVHFEIGGSDVELATALRIVRPGFGPV